MCKYVKTLAFSIVLLGPLSANAKSVTIWDVTDNFASQDWQANTNMHMTQTADGIRLQPTQAEATLRKSVDIPHSVDVIRMWYTTPADTEMKAMWSTVDSGNDMYAAPLTLLKNSAGKIIEIDYNRFAAWDHHPTTIGFWFPEGADVTIRRMELIRWNPIEKFGSMLRGFWQFDDIGPYTINFLWGPRLSFNPVQTTQMFWTNPPGGKSANWLLYGILALSAAYMWIKKENWKKFALVFACLWLLYDVRMGTEFISYAYDDYQSYYSEEIGVRTFRDRSFFNDLATAIRPLVQGEEKYIFVTEYRWPYLGLIRYYTYPSIPTHPFDGNANIYPVWVVYKRPDIQINTEGRLVSGQQILSPPGKVLHEFAPGSFVFRATL